MKPDVIAAARSLFDADPDRVRCPYPVYAALREQAPVAWFEELDAYVVTDYELAAEVLRQPEVFSSRSTTGPVEDRKIRQAMIELVAENESVAAMMAKRREEGTVPVLVRADPPIHGRQRALVNRAFAPSAIRALDADIEALTDSLIDAFVDEGFVELVSELAVPLPMTVIAVALGVSLDRRDDFKRWSDGITGGVGRTRLGKEELATIVRSRSELEAYLGEVIAARDRDAREDLVSRIVHARVGGERLSYHEVMDMIVQFLLAGNETTAKLITSTVLHLAEQPDVADDLRSDPEKVPPFVEEMLRLEPPSQGLYRIALADYELGGVQIPDGAAVFVAFAAANRDPDQFDAPDECVVERETGAPHLGFGLGAHFCLGAGLARAEARIAIQRLIARCTDIRLAIDPGAIEYEPSFIVHGIRRLPLTFRKLG
jgi:cytochrome P450